MYLDYEFGNALIVICNRPQCKFFKSDFVCIFIDKIPLEIEQQYQDNMKWLSEAEKHKLVVGSQARILYSDQVGRVKIALAFNEAVAAGKLKVSLHSDGSSTYPFG